MSKYIARIVFSDDDFLKDDLVTPRKAEVKKFALQAIKNGAKSVDIYYTSKEFGESYIGSFYDDGEMPRIFTK